ncbi:hypothetical protein FD967_06455 [Polynucleobacter sp. JS-Mosq-20-D10]|jgi:hypothetical protein|uniref:hypothetical protein n=1 Tax=Polynucleobacter sp. JS-Mosq-20-D10 TaxID=2576922 RepID=UPI001BFE439C|nr:hypothetical protein [Polynucleobacter sp. JS-Mosq-20-D10]QWD99692.1 hypothetical protein FD967_06455 [Polynucleobacter sp. JS-Mosq-20-D10]
MHKTVALLILALGLSACGRETYTTWSCIDSAGNKSSMVLKKAQMQFQDRQYDFCGSLGPLSYFDLKCPTQIQDSSNIFTTSSGKLVSNTNEFQCNEL